MDAYVYGVTRSAAAPPPSTTGVDGQTVEAVFENGLAAIVSDAPSVPVKASRRNLMAHSQVLQAVSDQRCVLPMRFGVVMPGRAAVREELLGLHAAALLAQLDELDGLVELDVRALSSEEGLLRAAVAGRSDITRLRAQLEGQPLEATYYERIRLGELVAQAVGDVREAIAARIAGELEPHAAVAQRDDPQHEHVLASLAFLVERERVKEFDAAVERLGAQLGSDIRLRYVGPLPPHSFVDLSAELEAEAWA